MRFIVFVALCSYAHAEYTCICNYNTHRTVFSETSETSDQLGSLSLNGCYKVISPSLMKNTWSSIELMNQTGYIKKDASTDILTCTGSPTDIEKATTDTTTSTSTPTVPTSVVTTSAMTLSTTTTPMVTQPSTVPTVTSPASPNNSMHTCPQAVYNSTIADNATLIINQVEKKCYEFIQSPQTWSTAEVNCQKNGGHLVTIRNVNENNELYAYVKAYGHNTWLGLNDKSQEDTFIWVSGDNSSYSNWRSGHLNVFIHGSEDCVCMLPSTGYWEDIRCSHSYPYICEYGSIPDVSGNPATQTPMTPDGNVHLCHLSDVLGANSNTSLGQYGDSCYVLTNGSHETWSSAESTCSRHDGHLAHIRNADEQNFILSFLKRHTSVLPTWIGLSDTKHEGQYQWSNGDAVTYTNWITGFNGTNHNSEDCVVMLPNQTGKWDEVYCGSHGGFFNSHTERHQMLCQYKTQSHASSILVG